MNKFLYIFLVFFVVACTSNTIIKKPDNLIPKDKMVELLTDMFMASGADNIKNIHQKRKVNYFPLVFEKHQIDSTQFKESNFYYISKIDDYEAILKRVDVRLKKMKKEFDDERKLLDSLENHKSIFDDEEDAYIK